MCCGRSVWVGVVYLRKDERICISEGIFECGMSGFHVGVNGGREAWYFVCVEGIFV